MKITGLALSILAVSLFLSLPLVADPLAGPVPDAIVTLCDDATALDPGSLADDKARKALGKGLRKLDKALGKLGQGKKNSLKSALGGIAGVLKKFGKAGIDTHLTAGVDSLVSAVGADISGREQAISARLTPDAALTKKFGKSFARLLAKGDRNDELLAAGDEAKYLKKSGGQIVSLGKLAAKIEKAGGEAPNPNAGKGRVLLGPIAGGAFEIHDLSDLSSGPVATGTTTGGGMDEAGLIHVDPSGFSGGKLFLVIVTGGDDIDADDDGVLDAVPTPLLGKIHGVLTGAQIKAGDWRLNVLTEVAYQSVRHLLEAGYADEKVVDTLDQASRRLLHADLTGDGEVDSDDLNRWDPVMHAGWNVLTEDQVRDIVVALHKGDDTSAVSIESTAAWVGREAEIPVARDVVVDGALAYVACDTYGLSIVNVSDPSEPRLVGRLPKWRTGQSVAAGGDYAALALHDRLELIDVSNPASPYRFWDYEGLAPLSILVSGEFIYLTTASTFDVIDLRYRTDGDDQTNQPVKTSIAFSGYFGPMHLDGTRLYVPNRSRKLGVYDLTDPAQPEFDRWINIPTNAKGHIHANHLYRTVGSFPTQVVLEVVDMTDPEDAQLVRTLLLPTNQITDTRLRNGVFYVSTLKGVLTVDLSTPGDPVISGRIPVGDATPSDIAVTSGEHPYLLTISDRNFNDNRSELDVYDVADPSPRGVAGSLELSSFVGGIALDGDRAVAAGGTPGHLHVLDLSDPSAPSLTSDVKIPHPTSTTSSEEVNDVAIFGTHALVGASYALHVVLIPASGAPTVVDSLTDFPRPYQVVSGRSGFAYLVREGVRQIDVSDLGGIAEGLVASGDSTGVDIAVIPGASSDRVFACGVTGWGKFDVYSFATGTGVATSLGTWTGPDAHDPKGVCVVGDTAWVVTQDFSDDVRLRALDVQTPGSITEIGSLRIEGGSKVRVSGDYAVVADPRFGVRIYDISDPMAIEPVSETVTLGGADDIEIKDGFVIIGNRYGVETVRLPVRVMP